MRIDAAEKIRTFVLDTLICLTGTVCGGQKNHSELAASPNAPQFMTALYEDLKWQAIVPELGEDSPQFAILRVDPATKATQSLIRTPRKVHVPVHWHSANGTHTIIQGTPTFEQDGKLQLMTPGGFQLTCRPICNTRRGPQKAQSSLSPLMVPGT